MTLALYGKSKRRQGGLMLAALMAILFATFGGVATLQGANAIPVDNSANACPTGADNTVWSSNNVSVAPPAGQVVDKICIKSGKDTFGSPDPFFVNNANAYPISTNGTYGYGTAQPSGGCYVVAGFPTGTTVTVDKKVGNCKDISHVSFYYKAAPGTRTVYVGKVVWPESSSHAGGTFSGTISPGGAGDTTWSVSLAANADYSANQSRTVSTAAQTFAETSMPAGGWSLVNIFYKPGNVACIAPWNGNGFTQGTTIPTGTGVYTVCIKNHPPARIIVKKVVAGTGADASTGFTANINNTGGSEGDLTNLAFSQTTPGVDSFSTDGGHNYTVTENTPPTNWTLTGKKILSGDATCPAATGSWDAAGMASGGALNGLNSGDAVTVCFRNTYTPPTTGTVIVKKVGNFTAAQTTLNFGGAITSAAPVYSGTWTADVDASDTKTSLAAGTYTVTETSGLGANIVGGTITLGGYKVLAAGSTAATACGTGGFSTAAGANQVAINGDTRVICIQNVFAETLVAAPTISKVKVDANHYTVTVHNAGGADATGISVSDTFTQGGTSQTITTVTKTPSAGGCTVASGGLSFSCTGLTAPANGDLVISVTMSTYTNTESCSDQTVTNTATATFDGKAISVTPGASNSATNTFKSEKAGCNNGTIIIKKMVSGTASSATDAFGGTLNSQTSNAVVQSFSDLKGNNDKSYSVAPGTYSTTETVFNGYTLLGYATGYKDGSAFCPEAPTSTTASSVTQTVATGDEKVLCIYNKKDTAPAQKVTFIKAICPNYGSVPANANFTNADETGGHANELNAAANQGRVALSDVGNCVRVAGWEFKLLDHLSGDGLVNTGTNLHPGIVTTATGAYDGGAGIDVTLTAAELALAKANNLWVSEIPQAGYGFGSLRCFDDVLNGDNDEFIGLSGITTPTTDHVICIAFNVGPRDLTIKKVVVGDSTDSTAFNVKVDGLNPAFPITQQTPKQTEISAGATHTVTETAATGYAILGWQIVNGANATCPSAPTGASANVSGLNGTANIASGADAVTVCFYNYPTTFSGVCGLPNGAFLALDPATVNGLTGYWYTPNVYGWTAPSPLGNPGAGNAFDHNWVQVEDAGVGHRVVWSLPVNTGTNVVRVFPSIDHADNGATTGSAANEANEYTVWGSNDGTTWVAQAVGGVPFDPTPGPYIADNAARDFTFPGGLTYRYIGIQVNLAAGVGTDAEIDALCAGNPGPLNGSIIVRKVKDPSTNQPTDGSQFSGNIDGVSGTAWGAIGFNQTTSPISVTAGSHTFAETGTENAWTPVGYAVVTDANVESACPASRGDYTFGTPVSVSANQTTLICVMNTKASLVALPTVKKVKVDATHYTITVTNAGGLDATNISVNDTFNPGATSQLISTVSKTPTTGSCTVALNGLSFACTGLTAPANGSLVISVTMTGYTNTGVCSDQIVTNTVTATFDTQGAITITPGSSNVATHAFPTTRTDCNNGTIAVKKVRDPGAASFADGSLFSGTIDGSSWGNPITFDGVTPPQSVGPGNHTVTETSAGGWILVGYQVFTNSSTTAACPTDSRGYSQSYTNGVTAPVATGQLTLVCVMNTKAAPPPPPPLCTFCTPLILSTPTPTPTNPPTVPTNTPVATNTPKTTDQPVITKPTETVNAVAGEKTPGPGAKSTPIAPSTGTGLSGAAASFNGLLALIGIAILGAGMALMAAGRRKTLD